MAVAAKSAGVSLEYHDDGSPFEQELWRIFREASRGADRIWISDQIAKLTDADPDNLTSTAMLHLRTSIPMEIVERLSGASTGASLSQTMLRCEGALREYRAMMGSLDDILLTIGFGSPISDPGSIDSEIIRGVWDIMILAKSDLERALSTLPHDAGDKLSTIGDLRGGPVEVEGDWFDSYHHAVVSRVRIALSLTSGATLEGWDVAAKTVMDSVRSSNGQCRFSKITVGLKNEERLLSDFLNPASRTPSTQREDADAESPKVEILWSSPEGLRKAIDILRAMPGDRFLPRKEITTKLNVSQKAISKWKRRGTIASSTNSKGRDTFKAAAILCHLERLLEIAEKTVSLNRSGRTNIRR